MARGDQMTSRDRAEFPPARGARETSVAPPPPVPGNHPSTSNGVRRATEVSARAPLDDLTAQMMNVLHKVSSHALHLALRKEALSERACPDVSPNALVS